MRKGDPITTYSGVSFYILDPREEEILDVDIAHSLSLLCRANGHFKHFYSIAQHALNCLLEARTRGFNTRVQMACLVHDGSEAYISDITRPVKQYLPAYKDIEHTIQTIIFRRYGVENLTEEEQSQLALVDDILLYHEFASLNRLSLTESLPEKLAEFDFSFRDMQEVEDEFLRELKGLSAQLSGEVKGA